MRDGPSLSLGSTLISKPKGLWEKSERAGLPESPHFLPLGPVHLTLPLTWHERSGRPALCVSLRSSPRHVELQRPCVLLGQPPPGSLTHKGPSWGAEKAGKQIFSFLTLGQKPLDSGSPPRSADSGRRHSLTGDVTKRSFHVRRYGLGHPRGSRDNGLGTGRAKFGAWPASPPPYSPKLSPADARREGTHVSQCDSIMSTLQSRSHSVVIFLQDQILCCVAPKHRS